MSRLLSTRSNEQLQRLALLLLIIVVGLLNGVFSYIEFRELRRDQQDTLANQAALVSANLELHIRSTHQVLQEIVASHGFLSHEQQAERMQALANAMPIIRGIGMLNSRGFPLGGTRMIPQGTNFSDRPYFQNAQADRQRHRLYISTPFSDITGNLSFALSKAMMDEQNVFQGVVFAILEPSYIEKLMGSTLYTPDMWAALLHLDAGQGIWVGTSQAPARRPPVLSQQEIASLLPHISDLDRKSFVWSGTETRHIMAVSAVKGLVSPGEKPLMVVMGRSHDEAMDNWKRLVYIQAGLFLLLAVSAYWGLIFYQYRRREYVATRIADQRLIEEREHDYRVIVERTADCVLHLDAEGRLSYANPAFLALFEGLPSTGAPASFLDLVAEEDREKARTALLLALEKASEQRLQVLCNTRSGARHMEWTLCSASGVADRVTGVIAVGRDVSAQFALTRELRSRAEQDSLTDLANRGHFWNVATAMLNRMVRAKRPVALLMIDLDFFKEVNDRWGHHAGDTALKLCADLIRKFCREQDIAGRLGGEEFAVLLAGTLEEAAGVAERLRMAIASEPVTLTNGQQFHLTASIGVAQREAGEDLEALMQRADAALYTAKQKGRDSVALAGRPPFTD